jgi:hypothetical protein
VNRCRNAPAIVGIVERTTFVFECKRCSYAYCLHGEVKDWKLGVTSCSNFKLNKKFKLSHDSLIFASFSSFLLVFSPGFQSHPLIISPTETEISNHAFDSGLSFFTE